MELFFLLQNIPGTGFSHIGIVAWNRNEKDKRFAPTCISRYFFSCHAHEKWNLGFNRERQKRRKRESQGEKELLASVGFWLLVSGLQGSYLLDQVYPLDGLTGSPTWGRRIRMKNTDLLTHKLFKLLCELCPWCPKSPFYVSVQIFPSQAFLCRSSRDVDSTSRPNF
jgi:hypothetical protein